MVGIGIAALASAAPQVARAANGGIASQTYKVNDSSQIITADKKQATLADLKVGNKVSISCRSQNGALLADQIVVQQPRTTQQPRTFLPSGQPQPRPKPTNELHAGGTIININTKPTR